MKTIVELYLFVQVVLPVLNRLVRIRRKGESTVISSTALGILVLGNCSCCDDFLSTWGTCHILFTTLLLPFNSILSMIL